ncbi:deoxycytidyl transferase [Maudiozyma humilis]|uniref:DNA repair protein REV1 n=1 Tax=Maudiozyma humilis TaxID=51915 RepID=A0AAV5S5V0_MAUHU|nr:deoxycytidyl transferase [Kazachstania humilis]
MPDSPGKDSDTREDDNVSHGGYFHNKRVKQRAQDRALQAQMPAGSTSRVLSGCTVYVNGHTDPPRLALHDLVVRHGGVFLHYLSSKGAATHIVAEHLPPRKRVEFRNCKVVSPRWLLDSVQQGRQLPWAPYSVLGGSALSAFPVTSVASAEGSTPTLAAESSNTPTVAAEHTNTPTVPSVSAPTVAAGNSITRTVASPTVPATRADAPSTRADAPAARAETFPTVASDPEAFLRSYFEHSRLHKLSEWKARLRQEFVRAHSAEPPLTAPPTRVLHIDFDCFFATVAFLHRDKRRFPSLDFARDPVAVCHGRGSSDVASCNYAARALGVRNGMWAASAQRRMPAGTTLTLLPYDFAAIEAASAAFYAVLRGCPDFRWVLPVSIDEAVCVLRGEGEDEIALAQQLRREIRERTGGCTASVGIGASLVLARLALRLAKPDGVYAAGGDPSPPDSFWEQFGVRDLPGVGGAAVAKLGGADTATLSTLRHSTTLPSLQTQLGNKLGGKVWAALHGQDDRESQRMLLDPCAVFDRKSVAVDINWGIRFATVPQVDAFLDVCAGYVANKLRECGKRAGNVTLKLHRRAAGAPVEPPKYLGMGRCDAVSQAAGLGVPSGDVGVLATELKALFRALAVPVRELRGVAVHLAKLCGDQEVGPRTPGQWLGKGRVGAGALPAPVSTTPKATTPKGSAGTSAERYRRLRVSPVKDRAAVPRPAASDPGVAAFLEALPSQLQREVRRDLAGAIGESGVGRGRLRAEMQRRAEAARAVNAHLTGSGGTLLAPVRFQGEASFKRVCRTVEAWVAATCSGNGASDGPHERDVLVFLRYVEKLCVGDRVHLALRVASLVSTALALRETSCGDTRAYAEWEHILVRRVLPVLNRNRLTFQTERKLDVEWEV